MGRKDVGSPPPEWRRLQSVMRVQVGLWTVAEACRELGLSRPAYYELEEKVLGAAVGSLAPRKPGPKPKEVDPKVAEMEEKLRMAEREQELLQLKVKDLEEVNEAIRTRVLGETNGGGKGR